MLSKSNTNRNARLYVVLMLAAVLTAAILGGCALSGQAPDSILRPPSSVSSPTPEDGPVQAPGSTTDSQAQTTNEDGGEGALPTTGSQDALTTDTSTRYAAQTNEYGEYEAPYAYEDAAESGLSLSEGRGWQEVDPFNTEEYRTIDEGSFSSAVTNPLSTLSADVDTASYCNLRRMVADGFDVSEIPSGSIRIEEMLNYFTYDYALPEGDNLFGTTVYVADCPWNSATKLVTLGFATAPEKRDAHKGSNLVFLVDISGSMDASDKLPLLQDAFGVLVRELGENDRVSIVTYASGEEVVLEGARGSDREKIMRAIGQLHADGSTNGEAGLRMAYQLAQDNFIEGGVNRIILASDGDLNVGMTDESSLEDYVAKQRETGVYLSVLGFGSGNYKDNKMEVLADNGNGQYHYIDCIEEAQHVFGEKLTANLVPLADNVKLQVEFNPATVKGYRLIGYENRAVADEDFRNDAKDAGDVGPGHQFTVAYEVALVGSEQAVPASELKYGTQNAESPALDGASGEWLTCTMRYRPAGTNEAREQSFVVSEANVELDPAGDWKFAAAVIEAGMILRGSEYAQGATLDNVLALLDSSEKDPQRAEFAQMIDRLSLRSSYSKYSADISW